MTITPHNEATDSENRIHADDTAQAYGYRGGLVPGVTVFGYMMKAAPEKPRSLRLRLIKPVFDGDELIIKREGDTIKAIRGDEICAEVHIEPVALDIDPIPEGPLPTDRPSRPTRETILGTLHESLTDANPETLMNLANQAFIQNFDLDPWLHVSSEVINHVEPQLGAEITVCSRIHNRFVKKGRDFVTIDVIIWQSGEPIQTVRHTALLLAANAENAAHP